jgi:hypothetical protein
MIVELFGPPCAGKTTFARMLASDLEARGLSARCVISARASELDAAPADQRAAHRRSRAAETLVAQQEACDAVNRAVLRLLPPRNWLWRFRLRRYLRTLATSWARGHAAADIMVFDQGYTQALCSLVSLARKPDPSCVRAAIDLLPEPALRIGLTVPRDVLVARLNQRARDLTFRERILELNSETILEQDRICAALFEILDGRGKVVGSVTSGSTDMPPFLDSVARALRSLTVERGRPGLRELREVSPL